MASSPQSGRGEHPGEAPGGGGKGGYGFGIAKAGVGRADEIRQCACRPTCKPTLCTALWAEHRRALSSGGQALMSWAVGNAHVERRGTQNRCQERRRSIH
jgi:hypothetical protein